MNDELKQLVKLGVDVFGAGKSAIEKDDFVTVLIPKLYKVASDIPGVVGGIAGLSAEIEALKTAEADADLVAYVVSTVAGVTDDAKAVAVLSAVLVAVGHVVQDVIAIDKALKS